jgi:hypothetical protein
VLSEIDPFGGLFHLDRKRYHDPVLAPKTPTASARS